MIKIRFHHLNGNSTLTCIGPCTKKLTNVENKQMITIPRIKTFVLANNDAPTKHTININAAMIVQYRNRHHGESGMRPASPPMN